MEFNNRLHHLEREIAENSRFFADLVAYGCARNDDKEDTKEFRKNRSKYIYPFNVIDLTQEFFKSVFGNRDDHGKPDVLRSVRWIREAQDQATKLVRFKRINSHIGQLLSKAEPGLDGVWPAEEICEVIEKTGTVDMKDGFIEEKFNGCEMTAKDNNEFFEKASKLA